MTSRTSNQTRAPSHEVGRVTGASRHPRLETEPTEIEDRGNHCHDPDCPGERERLLKKITAVKMLDERKMIDWFLPSSVSAYQHSFFRLRVFSPFQNLTVR